jgi:hypothetical protein
MNANNAVNNAPALNTNARIEWGRLPSDSPFKTHPDFSPEFPGTCGPIGRHRPMTREECVEIFESLVGKVDMHERQYCDCDYGLDFYVATTSKGDMIAALTPWADRIEVNIERFKTDDDDGTYEYFFTVYRLA